MIFSIFLEDFVWRPIAETLSWSIVYQPVDKVQELLSFIIRTS